MSEFNDEYNNGLYFDGNRSEPMSLDGRKAQLTEKIEQQMNSDASVGVNGAPVQKTEVSDNQPTAAQMGFIPQLNDNSGVKGGSNPYNPSVRLNDYTGGAPFGMPVVKKKLSVGLKAYLTIIVSLCVIFLGMFIFECIRAYNENGIFGGDLERFLDPDYGFGYDLMPDPYDSDDDSWEDSDDIADSDAGTTDVITEEIVAAPDENTLINESAANISIHDQPDDIDSVNYSARSTYKKVENSVVSIVTYKNAVGENEEKSGTGSGIIISADGYIATNSHVIDDSKDTPVEVILTNGNSYIARVVGFDVRTDLAVVKINASGLTPVEFVNSDQIEVGQDAIAVGNPGGVNYSNSLTRGCVSALNRTVKSNALVPYIQTDAAINPGNSGGPLLNSAGQVMGINTIKIANSDYEGMGFAIPSNTVVSISNDIIRQGYVSNRVRIGISGVSASSLGTIEGVVIKSIADDSPLKNTDVKPEDVITAINGEEIDGMPALYSEFAKYQPGDTVTVSIYRKPTATSKSTTFDVTVTLIADNGETQK